MRFDQIPTNVYKQFGNLFFLNAIHRSVLNIFFAKILVLPQVFALCIFPFSLTIDWEDLPQAPIIS